MRAWPAAKEERDSERVGVLLRLVAPCSRRFCAFARATASLPKVEIQLQGANLKSGRVRTGKRTGHALRWERGTDYDGMREGKECGGMAGPGAIPGPLELGGESNLKRKQADDDKAVIKIATSTRSGSRNRIRPFMIGFEFLAIGLSRTSSSAVTVSCARMRARE